MFLTEHAGTGTIWTVVRCGPKTGGPIIMVTYDLTALAPRLSADVDRFARDYPRFIAHWQESIAQALSLREQHPSTS